MVDTLEIISVGKLLHVKATGKLSKESYETFAPVVDEQIQEKAVPLGRAHFGYVEVRLGRPDGDILGVRRKIRQVHVAGRDPDTDACSQGAIIGGLDVPTSPFTFDGTARPASSSNVG